MNYTLLPVVTLAEDSGYLYSYLPVAITALALTSGKVTEISASQLVHEDYHFTYAELMAVKKVLTSYCGYVQLDFDGLHGEVTFIHISDTDVEVLSYFNEIPEITTFTRGEYWTLLRSVLQSQDGKSLAKLVGDKDQDYGQVEIDTITFTKYTL